MRGQMIAATAMLMLGLGISLVDVRAESSGAPYTYRTWTTENGVTCTERVPTGFAPAGSPTVYNYSWSTSVGIGNPCSETPAEDTLEFAKVAFTPSEVQVECGIGGTHFLRGWDTCFDCPESSGFAPQPPFCDDANSDPAGEDLSTKWLAYDQALCVYTNWPRESVAGHPCPVSPGYNTQVNSGLGVLIHRQEVSYDPLDGGTYSVGGVEKPAGTYQEVKVYPTAPATVDPTWDWDAGGPTDVLDTTIFTETDRTVMGEFQGTGNFVMEFGVGFDQELDYTGCTHRYTEDIDYDEVEIEIRIYP